MSASLVGSEMCIRDRNRPAGAPEAILGGGPGGQSPPGKTQCERQSAIRKSVNRQSVIRQSATRLTIAE
eukprot:9947871-Alexandrium_andersonii.AAC.1